MKPLVSIVVPARNSARTLPRALEGVGSQRTPWDFETIVVDNGSTDETAALAERSGARVVAEPRPGASQARNAGLHAARGEIVAFLDSDCFPLDSWLVALVEALQADQALGGVGGRVEAAPSDSLLQRYAERKGYLSQEQALANRYLPWVLTANCCYWHRALIDLGGFDERYTAGAGEDVDLAWRLQLQLGLGIGFAPRAVVAHEHRSTLLELWRQWVKYGWAGAQLDERFPERTVPPPIGLVDAAAWIAARLRRELKAVHGLATGRGDRVDLVEPLLEVVERVAHRVGQRQARRAAARRHSLDVAASPRSP